MSMVEIRSILVVEDDELSARLLCSILERAGYKTHFCSGGAQAIDYIDSAEFDADLVITDIMMPEMSGWEVINHLLESPKRRNFMVVSSSRDEITLSRIQSMGASGFIRKPFKRTEILNTLNQYIMSQANKSLDKIFG
jgi:CheY-like chemotaxis protein